MKIQIKNRFDSSVIFECEADSMKMAVGLAIKLKVNLYEKDEFIEWEEVYEGAFYGTLKSEIIRNWQAGRHVVFDVDVKGGISLKKVFKDRALSVFVKVPSPELIEQRLRARGTESEDSLSRRLFKLRFEEGFQDQFDVVLMNDHLPDTLENAQQLYDSFLSQPVSEEARKLDEDWMQYTPIK